MYFWIWKEITLPWLSDGKLCYKLQQAAFTCSYLLSISVELSSRVQVFVGASNMCFLATVQTRDAS